MDKLKILDSGMTNLDAYKLGLVVCKVNKSKKIGDEIDRGLILTRILKEEGFFLIKDIK